ncbi:MAG: PaaI family thioesterase [Actinomycetota bacterium]
MPGPDPAANEPAHALNAAIRDLIEVVRTSDLDAVDDAVIAAHTAAVAGVADTLRPHVVDEIRMQAALRYDALDSEAGARMIDVQDLSVDEYIAADRPNPETIFPYSPVVGARNPLSPPVRMWRAAGEDDDGAARGELHGEAVLGDAYNGPPGSVHGGVIAQVFDELLGCLCVTKGIGGFTGTLTVIYRNTTPLNTPITLRAWHDRTEGRKVFAKGTMHHRDTLCAEAEGIFILSEALSPSGGAPPGPVA